MQRIPSSRTASSRSVDRGIVVVVYTEREEGRLRIMGARLATLREQDLYYSHKDRFK